MFCYSATRKQGLEYSQPITASTVRHCLSSRSCITVTAVFRVSYFLACFPLTTEVVQTGIQLSCVRGDEEISGMGVAFAPESASWFSPILFAEAQPRDISAGPEHEKPLYCRHSRLPVFASSSKTGMIRRVRHCKSSEFAVFFNIGWLLFRARLRRPSILMRLFPSLSSRQLRSIRIWRASCSYLQQ